MGTQGHSFPSRSAGPQLPESLVPATHPHDPSTPASILLLFWKTFILINAFFRAGLKLIAYLWKPRTRKERSRRPFRQPELCTPDASASPTLCCFVIARTGCRGWGGGPGNEAVYWRGTRSLQGPEGAQQGGGGRGALGSSKARTKGPGRVSLVSCPFPPPDCSHFAAATPFRPREAEAAGGRAKRGRTGCSRQAEPCSASLGVTQAGRPCLLLDWGSEGQAQGVLRGVCVIRPKGLWGMRPRGRGISSAGSYL